MNIEKILTAEKFLKIKKYPLFTNDGGYGTAYVTEAIIEFAKLHVEAALKSASEKACLNTPTNDWQKRWIEEDSILDAYPLENIK